jgi:hypothetical protein
MVFGLTDLVLVYFTAQDQRPKTRFLNATNDKKELI